MTEAAQASSIVVPSAASSSLEGLAALIANSSKCVAITGAGISSGSGIPTYRDDAGVWKSNKPIQHAQFINSHAARQRYWARSFSGWPVINAAPINEAHRGLADLEEKGHIDCLVTQNVDRLHQKAGHKKVIDLHGRLDQVVCMDCGAIELRQDIQQWLKQNNPHLSEAATSIRPDGDADVQDSLVADVKTPSCKRCDGMLKPDVVFYGSSVEKPVVENIFQEIESASLLLIVGSSLMVFSSYRFCKFAAEHSIPIACINQGLTRADELFISKVSEDCGDVLQQLASQLP